MRGAELWAGRKGGSFRCLHVLQIDLGDFAPGFETHCRYLIFDLLGFDRNDKLSSPL